MVAARTSDDLVSAIIATAMLQSDGAGTISDPRISNSDVLEFASRLLSADVASVLLSARQQRWVWQADDVAITSGTAKYRIPSRALASGVDDIEIYDSTSGETFDPPQLSPRERFLYGNGRRGNWRSPYGYIWEGDHIVLIPTPDVTQYSLRVRFPRQPARLVAVSACAKVSSTTSTVITTAATVPTAWGSSETLDCVQGGLHADALGLDLAGTSISGTSITVSAGVPSELAANDYVCLAGTSCVIPLPESVWPLLVELVNVDVLRRIGADQTLLGQAIQAAQARRNAVRDVLEPRSRGESQRPIRRYSPLRLGRYPHGWRS